MMNSPSKLTLDEYEKFSAYSLSQYLPTNEKQKTVVAINENKHSQIAVHNINCVAKRGINLPLERNMLISLIAHDTMIS